MTVEGREYVPRDRCECLSFMAALSIRALGPGSREAEGFLLELLAAVAFAERPREGAS